MNYLFQQQIWEITKLIPKGRVTSYGAIAKAVGFPNHSRHVGKAMGGCPADVPAHRVCNASGHITASCLDLFTQKLATEGVKVEGNRIKDFKNVFWNPLEKI